MHSKIAMNNLMGENWHLDVVKFRIRGVQISKGPL